MAKKKTNSQVVKEHWEFIRALAKRTSTNVSQVQKAYQTLCAQFNDPKLNQGAPPHLWVQEVADQARKTIVTFKKKTNGSKVKKKAAAKKAPDPKPAPTPTTYVSATPEPGWKVLVQFTNTATMAQVVDALGRLDCVQSINLVKE